MKTQTTLVFDNSDIEHIIEAQLSSGRVYKIVTIVPVYCDGGWELSITYELDVKASA